MDKIACGPEDGKRKQKHAHTPKNSAREEKARQVGNDAVTASAERQASSLSVHFELSETTRFGLKMVMNDSFLR